MAAAVRIRHDTAGARYGWNMVVGPGAGPYESMRQPRCACLERDLRG